RRDLVLRHHRRRAAPGARRRARLHDPPPPEEGPMRPGPIVHGALLAAALGFAWQTWTREREAAPSLATLTIWPTAGTVEKVALHGTLRDVAVERRPGDYYWASVTKRTPRPAASPDAGVSVLETPPTTTEFPVGDEGEKAL